jgi:preprotein translocase subunit YajC
MSLFETNTFFAMASTTDGGSPWLQLVPFALVLGIFYFIILLPMRRKQQKVQQFLEGLKVGDKVVTTGGIYGQVTRLGGDSVQLQIADKVRIEISKAAVGGYQGQPPVQDAPASDEAKG